ncbi:uncharacterized protein N7459_009484 [Penicillium hispanicum]|uniref:uncharacterized protein n=1 Tax=Penicillium hispanicum TaxID=1080232 RepID=UPI0025424EC2|nr:uncharacterized protein N7459_009484 [Penicillium hispanicum]KAJ5570054.1 hypothetical protein N7459_009484 [Penicillium hispanicum]
MSVQEGTHTLPDGVQLYTKTWKPHTPPRAILAFVHGFSDHCNAYPELFSALASSAIEVRAFDQRGCGRTVQHPQDRGNMGPTSQVLADIHSFLLAIPQHTTPLFLMGHSMGGGEALTYALHPASPYHGQPDTPHRPIQLAGVLAYAPLIALAPTTQPSQLTVRSGRLAARILPRWQRASPVDTTLLSRDAQAVAAFAADPLNHDLGTLESLAAMLDRGAWLQRVTAADYRAAGLVPLWFAHGDTDRVTSCAATRRLAGVLRGAGDVTFVSYGGAYHVLHAELPEVKARFTRDLVGWVLARAPGLGEAGVVGGGQVCRRIGEVGNGIGDARDGKAKL